MIVTKTILSTHNLVFGNLGNAQTVVALRSGANLGQTNTARVELAVQDPHEVAVALNRILLEEEPPNRVATSAALVAALVYDQNGRGLVAVEREVVVVVARGWRRGHNMLESGLVNLGQIVAA